MRTFAHYFSLILLFVTLTGCSGGGGGSSSGGGGGSSPYYTGYFIDTNVSGLVYETASRQGITGTDGSFLYQAGDRITFKIGSTPIGTVRARDVTTNSGIVTPYTMYPNSTSAQRNLARVLLSIDRTPTGRTITLDENMQVVHNGLDLDDQDSVDAYLAKLQAAGLIKQEVSIDDAKAHLEETKATLSGEATVKKVTGRIIDGYVKNARLKIAALVEDNSRATFVNGKKVSHETTTDENGNFTTFISMKSETVLIEAEGGVDLATGENFEGTLKAHIINDPTNSDATTQHLTPLTTLISNTIDENASIAEVTVAKSNIAASLDLNSSDMDSDPIAMLDDNSSSAQGAKIIKKALLIQKTVEGFAKALNEPDANEVAYNTLGEKLNVAKNLGRRLARTTNDDPLLSLLDDLDTLKQTMLDKLEAKALAANSAIDLDILERKLEASTEAIRTISTLAQELPEASLLSAKELQTQAKALEVATSVLEEKIDLVNDGIEEVLNRPNITPAQIVEEVENLAKSVEEKVTKASKAIIVSGGVAGISKKISETKNEGSSDQSVDASRFATSFFNDQVIENQSKLYDTIAPVIQTASNDQATINKAFLQALADNNGSNDAARVIEKVQDKALAIEQEGVTSLADKEKIEKRIRAKQLIQQESIDSVKKEAEFIVQEASNAQELAKNLAKKIALNDATTVLNDATTITTLELEISDLEREYRTLVTSLANAKTALKRAKTVDDFTAILLTKNDVDRLDAQLQLKVATKKEKELTLSKLRKEQKQQVQEAMLQAMDDVTTANPTLQTFASELTTNVNRSQNDILSELTKIDTQKTENSTTLNEAKSSLDEAKERESKVIQSINLLEQNSDVNESTATFLMEQKDLADEKADDVIQEAIEESALKSARQDATEERKRVITLQSAQKQVERDSASSRYEEQVDAIVQLIIDTNTTLTQNNALVQTAQEKAKEVQTLESELDKVEEEARTLALLAANQAAADAEAIVEDFETLTLGSTTNAITTNLALPTVGPINATPIVWESSHTDIITASGVVTRPEYSDGDQDVVLTATLTRGIKVKTKIFSVRVLKKLPNDAQIAQEDFDLLTINRIKANNLNAKNILTHLTLPTVGENGSSIVWKSSKVALSKTGVVTRPSFETGNIGLELHASVIKGDTILTKTFNLIIIKLDRTDASFVRADKVALTLPERIELTTKTITLPTIGENGSTIVWQSSQPHYLANDGTVILRPSFTQSDETITLTATLTKGSYSETKRFFPLLIKREPTDFEVVEHVKNDLSLLVDQTNIKNSIFLPQVGIYGATIVWNITSSHGDIASYAAINGEILSITRPPFSLDNSNVKTFVLDANISKNGESVAKRFNLTIQETPRSPEAIVAIDTAGLKLAIDKTAVVNDFSLIASKASGSQIVWESSDKTYLVINDSRAIVNRPDFNLGDVSLSLTATVTYTNPQTKQSASEQKVFALTILKKENAYPKGYASAFQTDEDSALTSILLGTDAETNSSALTFNVDTLPNFGTLNIERNGNFQYQPNSNFNGSDSFTYKVFDGEFYSKASTIAITVKPVNDAPTVANRSISTKVNFIDENTTITGQLSGNDIDSTQLSFAKGASEASKLFVSTDGRFTFYPQIEQNNYTFRYKANDGELDSNEGSITLFVSIEEGAPVAEDLTIHVDEESNTTHQVRATDPNNDALTFSVVKQPLNGTLFFDKNGSFSYRPQENFTGEDSFTFYANDGTFNSQTAQVTINVLNINDAPTLSEGNFTIDEDTQLNTILEASDLENDAVTFQLLTPPSHGSANLTNEGFFTYTPQENNSSDVNVTIALRDGTDEQNATLFITIEAQNDAPRAQNIQISLNEDSNTTALFSASDLENNPLTFSTVLEPANGTVTIEQDSFTYQPNANFAGKDYFTYAANDGNASSNIARVNINVSAQNDAPTVSDHNITVAEDSNNSFNLLITDSDSDDFNMVLISSEVNGTTILTEQNGTAYFTKTVQADGRLVFSVAYQPKANFFGLDSFTYYAFDSEANSTIATVDINVTNVNDIPVAHNLSFSEEIANKVLQATDIDHDTLTFSAQTQPTLGTLILDSNGSFTYTRTNFSGSHDSFTYTAFDGRSRSTLATATITFENAPPQPQYATYSLGDDENISFVLEATDINDDNLTFSEVGHLNGVTLENNGSVTFVPSASGTFTLTFRVDDGTQTADGNITLHVIDVPVANDTTLNAIEDTLLRGDLRSLIVDSDTLISNQYFSVEQNPQHGILTLDRSGTFSYQPKANFDNNDTFSYRVFDGFKVSNIATVTLNITPQNDQPSVQDVDVSVLEDGNITVRLNAFDIDGDLLSIDVDDVPNVTASTVTSFIDNAQRIYQVTLTPEQNFNGLKTITYRASDGALTSTDATISLNVIATNDAPTSSDRLVVMDEDTIKAFTLQATDIDGDTLYFEPLTQPEHGTLLFSQQGAISYTPHDDYFGTDSFNYSVKDPDGLQSRSTVNFVINNINDAPTTQNRTISVNKNLSISSALEANDIDSAILTFSVENNVSHGTLILQSSGSFTYTPTLEYFGDDSFTYHVNDGNLSTSATVFITVNDVQDNVIAHDHTYTLGEDSNISFELNATDEDGDSVTFIIDENSLEHGTIAHLGANSYRYTPNANYFGVDTLTFRATDGIYQSNQATITFNITAQNDAPIAQNVSSTIDEDTNATYALSLFGSDVDGDTLTFTPTLLPRLGTLTQEGNTLKFIPHANAFGTETITFTLSDHNLTSTEQIFSVIITNVNDAPTVDDRTITVDEDSNITVELSAHDLDSDALTLHLQTDATHGSVTLESNGTLTYTPDPNYFGNDSFTYKAHDGTTFSQPATVSITIHPIQDINLARHSIALYENTAISDTVRASGAIIDSVQLTQTPVNGMVTIDNNGSFTYTADTNFNGSDSFIYTAKSGLEEANGTVHITVLADPLIFTPMSTLEEDQNVSILLGDASLVYGFDAALTTTTFADAMHLSIENNTLHLAPQANMMSVPLHTISVRAYNSIYDIFSAPKTISHQAIDTSHWWEEENRAIGRSININSNLVTSYTLYVDEALSISDEPYLNGLFFGRTIYVKDSNGTTLMSIDLAKDYAYTTHEANATNYNGQIGLEINGGEKKVYNLDEITPPVGTHYYEINY
jgi:VCBS repeat-containing protein